MVMMMKNYYELQQQGDSSVFRQLKNDHYLGLDIEYWQNKVTSCHNSYIQHKSMKYKARAVIDAYTTYLQLIEIFFINMHAASLPPEQFMIGLFMTNHDLRQYVSDIKNQKSNNLTLFFERILEPIVKAVGGSDDAAKDKLIRSYRSTFEEVVRDYLQDYEMLNAYKHGFRVGFSSGDSSVGIQGMDGIYHKIVSGDATVHYFSSTRRDGKTTVFEHTTTFNATRIFGKAHFVYVMLQNLVEVQKAIAQPKRKQRYRIFEIPDRNAWAKSTDSARWKMDFAAFYKEKPQAQ